MSIKINRTDTKIEIQSEYNSALPSRAKMIAGRWNAAKRAWVYPLSVEDEVKTLYEELYGEFEAPADLVALHCEVGDENLCKSCGPLALHGYIVARASARDGGAETAENIVIKAGGFRSGGSIKNWKTVVQAGTKFTIVDIPRKKAEQIADDPQWCESAIIEESKNDAPRNPLENFSDDMILAEAKRRGLI